MKEVFEKIRRQLVEKRERANKLHGKPHMDYGTLVGWASAMDEALSIVSEVEAELGKDINVRSNKSTEHINKSSDCSTGWIPIDSGKMPKADERVLCMHDDGFIDCGELVGESWCCDMDEYAIDRTCVVAWHPLPESYRRESE